MKYAVITSGGKQYKVTEGMSLELEKLSASPKDTVTFRDVLLYVDGEGSTVKVGGPFVEGVQVKATVVDHIKGDKIRVAKFKAKSRYRRVTGHRQHLTKVTISEISLDGETKIAKKDQEKEAAVKTAPAKIKQTKKTKETISKE